MENTGLGYDPDARTFTLEDDRWNEITKANPKYGVLIQTASVRGGAGQFFYNSATRDNTWVPTVMDPYRVKGRVKSMSIAMTTWCSWSFNTTNLSDAIDVVERLKHARTKN